MKKMKIKKAHTALFNRISLLNCILAILLMVSLFSCKTNSAAEEAEMKIIYPTENTLFPSDIAAPTIRWTDNTSTEKGYKIVVKKNEEVITTGQVRLKSWKPDTEIWSRIKEKAKTDNVTIAIYRQNENKIAATVNIACSRDDVGTPIFFRTVPLPFKFARENLKKINWHLGNVSSEEKAPEVLKNIPVCGNCHSFSTNGKYMGMDVDARDEKGAYVIAKFEENTVLSEDKLINWSESQNGEFTYGLLSQLSPDGKFVVSTLKDCEIFVDRNNLEYSQLFFPFKGILEIYDRELDKYYELAGANDTNFVHSNPTWSPDGKYIYFCRSRAAHYEESGIHHGSKATNHKIYSEFLNKFLEREELFKFDIYRIPFNNGKGGVAEPVLGASNNNLSNYFPKISPNGKWLVFTQAESFMLLQKDSKLKIIPADGGEARELNCNSDNMNSWHSWSPNSKWLTFASKANGPYTQLYLTHIDDDGNDSPAILLENMTFSGRAVNIPEFVNVHSEMKVEIDPAFLVQNDFALRSAQIKNKENDLENALAEFSSLLIVDPKNAEAYHGRGDVLAKLNKLDKAISDFNQAIKLNNNVPDYYLSRGIAFGNIRDYENAYNDFETAIELDPYSFMAYNDQAVLKVREGRIDDALGDYDKSIELNPNAAMTYVNRGAARAIKKDLSGALSDFEYAITLNSEIAMPYITRSMVKEKENNIAGAINDLNIAAQIEPENLNVLQRRAKLYLKMKNFHLAIEDLNHMIRINPERGDVYFHKAMVEIQLKNLDAACISLKEAQSKGYTEAEKYLKEYCKP